MITHWNTERLSASCIGAEHLDEVCQLHSDPLVMRTLSADGATVSDSETIPGLSEAELHWENYGFGVWVFHSRNDGKFVGREIEAAAFTSGCMKTTRMII